jgi:hypothetical protein
MPLGMIFAMEKLIGILGHPLFPPCFTFFTACGVFAFTFIRLSTENPKVAKWVKLGTLTIAVFTFISAVASYWVDKQSKADAERNHKQEITEVQSKLDRANERLGHIADCFKLNYDPHDCAIVARVLTSGTVATEQTIYTPNITVVPIGLSISEQRIMVSENLDQLADSITQEFKTKFLDRRAQMYPNSPLTGYAGQMVQNDMAHTLKTILTPLLPKIEEELKRADQIMPQVNSDFAARKEQVRGRCRVSEVDPVAEGCPKALIDLAAVIKPPDEKL